MKKRKENTSPMQIMFWINKGLSEDEAKYKIKSFRKINIEYWLERGYSLEESKIKVSEFQREQSLKFKAKREKDFSQYAKCYNNRIEYWLDKGYSLEEALEKLTKRQSTFSLEKCIKKYGETEGLVKFYKRQEKWQKSLYENKTDDEIIEMHKKCDCVSIDFFIRKGYTFEEAEVKNKEAIIKRFVKCSKASKQSLEIFLPLYNKLLNMGISQSDIFFGYKNKKEWYIYSNEHKRIFFYDFTIRSKKIIIEFQGSKFHYNKNIHDNSWRCLYSHTTPEESIKLDNMKKKLAEDRGFTVIYIWDNELKDINETINKTLNKL